MTAEYMIDAPAKINLTLKITGRRDDGYHLLDSLVIFAGLRDSISLTPEAEDQITVTGPFSAALADMPDDDHIIRKAINAYRAMTGWAQSFRITLDKHIPVAAGIGGGSSDAAAVLTLLNRHCPTAIADEDLMQLGLSIGADVPVCLGGMTHHLWRMRGVGETLEPVNYPPAARLGIILINPGVAVPTTTIFAALSSRQFADNGFGRNTPVIDPHTDPMTETDFHQWLDDGNSMEDAAISLYEEIGVGIAMMRALDDCDGFITAGMSGSGATAFAVFETEEHARAAYSDRINGPYWSWAGGVHHC